MSKGNALRIGALELHFHMDPDSLSGYYGLELFHGSRLACGR